MDIPEYLSMTIFDKIGLEGQCCYAFQTNRVAKQCLEHINNEGRVEEISFGDITIYAIYFPSQLEKDVHAFFQVTGENISPRMAADCLAASDIMFAARATYPTEGTYQFFQEPSMDLQTIRHCECKVKEELCCRIASFVGENPDSIFLFPTGMAATYNGMQLAKGMEKQQLNVCLGDTYRMFSLLGPNCRLVNASNVEELERIALEMTISLVFCEFPSNPLLISPDLTRLKEIADKHNFLVMLDVTLANFINLRGLNIADIIVISLTKIFSGQSDVMGGCLVIPKRSKYHFLLKVRQQAGYEDTLYCRDALILLRNSRNLQQRAQAINSNALKLAHVFSRSCRIKKVNYPKFITPHLYQAFMAPNGGYGGVMSIEFKFPSEAIAFYDALTLPKGMSIGANFTLVAPFAVLAYPDDIELAIDHGIHPFLVRISVGIEAYALLESSFQAALDAIPPAH